MSDLKPCPFCGGGAAAQALVNFDGYHFVGCECGAEGPASPSADDARSLWNTRPGEEALRKERDEARGELVKALREGLSESQRLKAERDEARAEVERLREWCVSPCSEAACDYDAMPGPCSEAPGRTCSECCPMHRCGGEA